MSTFDTPAQGVTLAVGGMPARRFAAVLFAAVLFVSALLLFAVQPMFTKMVLPKFGGSPSVWSTAMVTFQALLFAGYLYAHLMVRTLPPGRAAFVHLVLLAGVAMTLPLGIAAGFVQPPESGVTLWLVGLFVCSIGLPFVALAATAPLLQNWFIATGHPQAKNPYVLYAASNLGSFVALLAYPFLIEPLFALRTQATIWSCGFVLLAAGICAAGLMVSGRAGATQVVATDAPPTLGRRLSWMALTAIPAGLCIAVTAFITTDLAAAPLLWVVPLALYLLTFVGVFRERPWIPHAWVLRLLPYVVAPLAISVLGGAKVNWLAVIALNLTAFTLMALACHGEAYRLRPQPARLTEFYLWTSAGGVVGGIFAGLLAPNIFSNIYEYPILIAASLLVLPGIYDAGLRAFVMQSALPLALAALAVALRFALDVTLPFAADPAIQIGLVLLAALMMFQAARPALFWGLVVFAFAFTGSWQPGMTRLETVRSFFGVHQVVESSDRTHRMLFHGTTIHGAERVRDAAGNPVGGTPEPLTYYYFGGPLSEVIGSARQARGSLDRVALVGLGTGSLACHKREGERWTFFEIDPEVIRLARNPENFRFLSACGSGVEIITGDARLTLVASPVRYDMIVLDAFSSDAIPVHLLTREALAGYSARLAANGVIAIHVSNRHMELASVVAAVAAEEGFVAYFKQHREANDLLKDLRANSDVVALAHSEVVLGELPQRQGWRKIAPRPDVPGWTDDYSDVLSAILRKRFAR
jgi:predicted O-methyltransferase YrrM